MPRSLLYAFSGILLPRFPAASFFLYKSLSLVVSGVEGAQPSRWLRYALFEGFKHRGIVLLELECLNDVKIKKQKSDFFPSG